MSALPRLLGTLLASVLTMSGCVPDDTVIELTEAQRAAVRKEILSEAPTPQHPLGAVFGDAVELIGLDLDPPKPVPGQRFTVTWYWRCLQEQETDYMVFVHFDSESGGQRFHLDHHPVRGLHPIKHWKKGEIVRDIQKDRLDGDFPVGPATFWVGVYHQDARLPLKAGVPSDGNNRAQALKLQVVRAANAPPKRARGAARDLPRLTAYRAASPVNVDGRLDDPAWRAAAWTPAFGRPDGKPGPAPPKTEAAFLWDDEQLYVAFRSADDDVWTSLRRDDQDLWTQEVVELFIDADGDGKTYVELQVNPANALFDAYFPTYRSDLTEARRWSSRARHAVAVDGTLDDRSDQDRGWTVEIALPLDAIPSVPHVPPKAGDEWRVNMFRMDSPASGGQRAAAWSPPRVPDFHAVKRFGVLHFGGGFGPSAGVAAPPAPTAPSAPPKPGPTPSGGPAPGAPPETAPGPSGGM